MRDLSQFLFWTVLILTCCVGLLQVVSPLLCLMLGDGENLVVQVVPPALLEFSRSVLRSSFSSIVQKAI